MHPAKVDRSRLEALTDLPNVGPAIAADLRQLGYQRPADLVGVSALDMYQRLERVTGQRQDPCVLDTLVSIARFLQGEPAQPWWVYSAERKRAGGRG